MLFDKLGAVRVVVVFAVAAACAVPKPEPLRAPKPLPRPEVHATARKDMSSPPAATWSPRPNIDLVDAIMPDLHGEERWPLGFSEHPVLEPHFPVASELAVSGIGWTTLCSRGAQNRVIPGKRDLVSYLRAWCLTLDHREQEALEELAPLLTSPVRNLPAAVRLDLASILVSSDADRAAHLLEQARVRDAMIADMLTAFYFDAGQLQDAAAMNQYAAALDTNPAELTRCHRLARGALAGDYYPEPQLEQAFANVSDATCERLRVEMNCLMGLRAKLVSRCGEYVKSQKDPVAYDRFMNVNFTWPSGETGFESWAGFAYSALEARPLAGADELAVTAIENMRETVGCNAYELRKLYDKVKWAEATPLAADLGARLRRVKDSMFDRCPELREQATRSLLLP